jgi:hypothetical protein
MFWDNIGTIFKAQAIQEQADRTNMLSKVLVTNNQPTPHKIPEEQRPQQQYRVTLIKPKFHTQLYGSPTYSATVIPPV